MLERYADFIGNNLCQCGANTGAKIHMAVKCGDTAIGGQADKAVHAIERQIAAYLWRRCQGIKRHRQQAADHYQATGLQQAAARDFQAAHACPLSANS